MPYNISTDDIVKELSKESKNISKHFIYTTLFGTLAASLLGGESFSTMQSLGSISLPTPLLIGGSIGLGSSVALFTGDIITDLVLDNSKDRTTEKMIATNTIAALTGVTAMNYFSGIPPSLNAALMSVGSNIMGEYTQQNFDSMLLGVLW